MASKSQLLDELARGKRKSNEKRGTGGLGVLKGTWNVEEFH